MIRNENIICISSIDWDFIWQGHQEIMTTFSKNGNRVLFIENTGARAPGIKDISRVRDRIKNWLRGIKGIRKEAENLYIFSPLVLPFPYLRIARWINRHLIVSVLERWSRAMDFADPIVWAFLPTPLSMDIIDRLVEKSVIYYCIDNFSISSVSAKKIRKSERVLLKKADLVFVTSKALYDYCSEHSDRVYTFPFGVNFSEFEKARIKDDPAPEELRRIRRPIIGYVGGVHKWIDQDLIRLLAERHPDSSFVFVGPIQTGISLLKPLKNIYFLGSKDHAELPVFVKQFDVCIIPYLITDYTNNVYPTKLNEYLAMGKAIVSTALPEVIAFNKEYGDVVCVAEDKEMFSDCIKRLITEEDQSIRDRRMEVSKENTWESRVEKMSDLIEKEIERGKLDRGIKWKENLIYFYRATRGKVVKLGAIFVLVYLLLFKTAFLWFLAAPLKISDVPQKSDAIVVFGGGVGETGSPGKSTIERARYAAELYLKGYADRILFSSGYSYVYNDAENMKLIAVSMGVPHEDIVLDQEANSTYENVMFSKAIIDRLRWKSILLVSSPYNMRRAYLVFNKWGRGIKVYNAPVEKSQFYDRAFGIKMEQIGAIMHEYLGIIYYWAKGYI